jgi:hypothetical protein
MLLALTPSKEAFHAVPRPPPRPATNASQVAITVPLEQLWTRLAPTRQRELLTQLSRILSERLTPVTDKEQADE